MKTRSKRSHAMRRVVLAAVLAISALGVTASSAAADPDTTAPSADSLSIYGVPGSDPGYTKQGGYVYVCANNVVDGGSPPSGTASVTTDISAFGGPTASYNLAAFPMNNDWSNTALCSPFSVNSWEADWAVRKPLLEGTYPYSVTMKDYAGNSNTQSSTVVVDNTPPKGTDVQTANVGLSGKPEQGDSLTMTYNEMPGKYVGSETPRNVVVHIDNSGTNDVLSVWNTQNTRLDGYQGSVKLGKDYVSANRTFGATGTKSTVLRSGNSIILTLGTSSGTVNRVTSGGTMNWTPTGAFDRAGNVVLTTPVNESGPSDPDF